jgi:hypothetical protein
MPKKPSQAEIRKDALIALGMATPPPGILGFKDQVCRALGCSGAQLDEAVSLARLEALLPFIDGVGYVFGRGSADVRPWTKTRSRSLWTQLRTFEAQMLLTAQTETPGTLAHQEAVYVSMNLTVMRTNMGAMRNAIGA